ncbi:hypothetical protein [Noviluteimonas gilva]|uniref:Uncharacterized protein n=1 Tax=Noviluteimonas gilva TaxID=2682097 RepID=A0A7C9HR88_9GAMM|nr:hypothetical protein [Lysobacter gilvus]MUV13491.1 hypothetical protein [Lysobacter gilvus]
MPNSVVILIAIVWIALMVVVGTRQRRIDMARLRASFDALRFETAEGVVAGDKLLVVKEVAFEKSREGSMSLRSRMGETFWYCVGPGQSYWVAMPMRMPRKGPIEWVVHPLSEERMRAALSGDRQASAMAFGA